MWGGRSWKAFIGAAIQRGRHGFGLIVDEGGDVFRRKITSKVFLRCRPSADGCRVADLVRLETPDRTIGGKRDKLPICWRTGESRGQIFNDGEIFFENGVRIADVGRKPVTIQNACSSLLRQMAPMSTVVPRQDIFCTPIDGGVPTRVEKGGRPLRDNSDGLALISRGRRR